MEDLPEPCEATSMPAKRKAISNGSRRPAGNTEGKSAGSGKSRPALDVGAAGGPPGRGQIGAGPVIAWDTGSYDNRTEEPAGSADGLPAKQRGGGPAGWRRS
jgi:hypothetical protein